MTTRLLRMGANIGTANRSWALSSAAGDGGDAVEGDLGGEEAQEERGQLLLLGRLGARQPEGEQPDDPRGDDHGHHG